MNKKIINTTMIITSLIAILSLSGLYFEVQNSVLWLNTQILKIIGYISSFTAVLAGLISVNTQNKVNERSIGELKKNVEQKKEKIKKEIEKSKGNLSKLTGKFDNLKQKLIANADKAQKAIKLLDKALPGNIIDQKKLEENISKVESKIPNITKKLDDVKNKIEETTAKINILTNTYEKMGGDNPYAENIDKYSRNKMKNSNIANEVSPDLIFFTKSDATGIAWTSHRRILISVGILVPIILILILTYNMEAENAISNMKILIGIFFGFDIVFFGAFMSFIAASIRHNKQLKSKNDENKFNKQKQNQIKKKERKGKLGSQFINSLKLSWEKINLAIIIAGALLPIIFGIMIFMVYFEKNELINPLSITLAINTSIFGILWIIWIGLGVYIWSKSRSIARKKVLTIGKKLEYLNEVENPQYQTQHTSQHTSISSNTNTILFTKTDAIGLSWYSFRKFLIPIAILIPILLGFGAYVGKANLDINIVYILGPLFVSSIVYLFLWLLFIIKIPLNKKKLEKLNKNQLSENQSNQKESDSSSPMRKSYRLYSSAIIFVGTLIPIGIITFPLVLLLELDRVPTLIISSNIALIGVFLLLWVIVFITGIYFMNSFKKSANQKMKVNVTLNENHFSIGSFDKLPNNDAVLRENSKLYRNLYNIKSTGLVFFTRNDSVGLSWFKLRKFLIPVGIAVPALFFYILIMDSLKIDVPLEPLLLPLEILCILFDLLWLVFIGLVIIKYRSLNLENKKNRENNLNPKNNVTGFKKAYRKLSTPLLISTLFIPLIISIVLLSLVLEIRTLEPFALGSLAAVVAIITLLWIMVFILGIIYLGRSHDKASKKIVVTEMENRDRFNRLLPSLSDTSNPSNDNPHTQLVAFTRTDAVGLSWFAYRKYLIPLGMLILFLLAFAIYVGKSDLDINVGTIIIITLFVCLAYFIVWILFMVKVSRNHKKLMELNKSQNTQSVEEILSPVAKSYRLYSTALVIVGSIIPIGIFISLLLAAFQLRTPALVGLASTGTIFGIFLIIWILVIFTAFVFFAKAKKSAHNKAVIALTQTDKIEGSEHDASNKSATGDMILFTRSDSVGLAWFKFRKILIPLFIAILTLFTVTLYVSSARPESLFSQLRNIIFSLVGCTALFVLIWIAFLMAVLKNRRNMNAVNAAAVKDAHAPSGPFMQSYRNYSTALLMTVLLIPLFLLGALLALIMDQKPVGFALLGTLGLTVLIVLVLWIIIIVQGFIYFANARERAADKIAAMTHKGLLQPGDLDSAYSKESSQVLITKMEAASTSWKYFKIPVIVMSLALMIGFVGNTMYSLQMNALRDTMLLIMDILVKSAIVTTAFWSALGIHFIVTQRKATEFNTKLMLFVIAVALGIAGAVLFGISISQVMYHVQERNQTEIVPNLIKAVIGLGMLLSGLIIIGIYEFLSSREMKVKQITAFSKKDNHPNGSKLNKIFAINNDSISNKNDDWRVYTFNISTDSIETKPKNAMDFILQKLSEQNLSRDNLRKVSTFFKNNNFYVTQFPDTPPEVFPQAVIKLYEILLYISKDLFENNKNILITFSTLFEHPIIRKIFRMKSDKKIDIEIFNAETMKLIEEIDEKVFLVKDIYKYLVDEKYIIHIYDQKRPYTSGIQKGKIRDAFFDVEMEYINYVLELIMEEPYIPKGNRKEKLANIRDNINRSTLAFATDDDSDEIDVFRAIRSASYPFREEGNHIDFYNYNNRADMLGKRVLAYAEILTKNNRTYYIYYLSGNDKNDISQKDFVNWYDNTYDIHQIEKILEVDNDLSNVFEAIPSGDNDRNYDAERKILMSIAFHTDARVWNEKDMRYEDFKREPNILKIENIKKIRLVVDRAPCLSCRSIIYKFAKHYDHIKLIIDYLTIDYSSNSKVNQINTYLRDSSNIFERNIITIPWTVEKYFVVQDDPKSDPPLTDDIPFKISTSDHNRFFDLDNQETRTEVLSRIEVNSKVIN